MAYDMETVLDDMRKGRLIATPAIITTQLAGRDGLRAMVDRLMAGGVEVDDQTALDALIARQRQAAAGGDTGGADPLRLALSHDRAAIATGGVDDILPLDRIAVCILTLAEKRDTSPVQGALR